MSPRAASVRGLGTQAGAPGGAGNAAGCDVRSARARLAGRLRSARRARAPGRARAAGRAGSAGRTGAGSRTPARPRHRHLLAILVFLVLAFLLDALGGLGVDGLGELVQLLVGLFLFLERLLEQASHVVVPEHLCPGTKRAVRRDLVV